MLNLHRLLCRVAVSGDLDKVRLIYYLRGPSGECQILNAFQMCLSNVFDARKFSQVDKAVPTCALCAELVDKD